MELTKFRSFEDFEKYISPHINERLQVESSIAIELKKNKNLRIIRFCELCKKPTKFELKWNKSKPGVINYRDSTECQYCKLSSRKRFMLNFLKNSLTKPDLTVYMYEQATKTFQYVQNNFTKIKLIGSEYFGPDKKPGEIINKIRHENAEGLSFNDKSIDVIVSNDVYEHVSDIQKTLKEAYRVLKDDGILQISIPFNRKNLETNQRASIDNGQIKYLLPEIFHENPISKDGSLVFYDYGWDFLDFLKNTGFSDTFALGYYSIFYGYVCGGLQFHFVSKKSC